MKYEVEGSRPRGRPKRKCGEVCAKRLPSTKVLTDSNTEFGWNPILIDRIPIESAAGSNPISIVQIRTALDRAVDFNKRVTAFTTSRACIPSSDIKGGKADIQLRCGPAHNQCQLHCILCNTITRRDSDSS